MHQIPPIGQAHTERLTIRRPQQVIIPEKPVRVRLRQRHNLTLASPNRIRASPQLRSHHRRENVLIHPVKILHQRHTRRLRHKRTLLMVARLNWQVPLTITRTRLHKLCAPARRMSKRHRTIMRERRVDIHQHTPTPKISTPHADTFTSRPKRHLSIKPAPSDLLQAGLPSQVHLRHAPATSGSTLLNLRQLEDVLNPIPLQHRHPVTLHKSRRSEHTLRTITLQHSSTPPSPNLLAHHWATPPKPLHERPLTLSTHLRRQRRIRHPIVSHQSISLLRLHLRHLRHVLNTIPLHHRRIMLTLTSLIINEPPGTRLRA